MVSVSSELRYKKRKILCISSPMQSTTGNKIKFVTNIYFKLNYI